MEEPTLTMINMGDI